MRDIILEKLAEIEEVFNVTILFAIESGSRGWGFASTDSDYDVRFVYVHKHDWYLSLDDNRDVIEVPIDEVLDISGWDLKKAMNLARKSNAVFWEWLQSPIIYINKDDSIKKLFEITKSFCNPISTANHYLATARRTIQNHLQGDDIILKRYFYILRPLLASLWACTKGGVPPMEFAPLMELISEKKELTRVIWQLVDEKKEVGEKYRRQRVSVIDDFVINTIETIEKILPTLAFKKPSSENLNTLFRELVLTND